MAAFPVCKTGDMTERKAIDLQKIV